MVFSGREFFRIGSGDHDTPCGHPALVFDGFRATDVYDLGGLGQYHVSSQDGFFFNDDAFYDNTAGAQEAIVLDDNGVRL